MKLNMTNDEEGNASPKTKVPIPNAPKYEFLGEGQIYKFPSRTRFGQYHFAIVIETEPNEYVVKCSCEGFNYKKYCWHVTLVEQECL